MSYMLSTDMIAVQGLLAHELHCTKQYRHSKCFWGEHAGECQDTKIFKGIGVLSKTNRNLERNANNDDSGL